MISQAEFSQHIDLSVLPRLQIIRLKHYITDYSNDTWIYAALSQLGSSVEVIELNFKSNIIPTHNTAGLDWNRIRLVLEDRNLPSLRQLRIGRPEWERNDAGTQDLITSQLPEYHARGILSFHFF